MALYIRIVDKDKFKSPVLWINSDEDKFLKIINKWREELLIWANNPKNQGLPLGYIDAHTAIVDLLRVLTDYYVNDPFNKTGRIHMTFSLYDNSSMKNEKITDILV